MRIKCRVSRAANHFFFISTLAAWHYSCRKDIRDEWLRTTGKLTPREEKALADFASLMQTKYGFGPSASYLGDIFYKYTGQTVWRALKSFVTAPEDYQVLKNTFSVFEKRFTKVWQAKNIAPLMALKSALREKRSLEFLRSLESCFGKKGVLGAPVVILILFSPLDRHHTSAGGANLKGNFITLELPALEKNSWQMSYSLAILGHEIGHMLFSGRSGSVLIRTVIKDLHLKKKYGQLPFETFSILNEAITAAFAPLGALGQSYFPAELSPLLFESISRINVVPIKHSSAKIISYYGNLEILFVWTLFPLTVAYVREKKPIDLAFVREAGVFLKKIVE
ncbi:MAG: hypothetical protein P4L81_07925 [Candidatus Pacebacteria bacterium]|nr:hypothetical protein [Candidatus Paceibacterota bacterium]